MIQIGALEWVEPNEVAGVRWDHYTDRMPLVVLKSGYEIRADCHSVNKSAGTEQRQVAIEALITDLSQS